MRPDDEHKGFPVLVRISSEDGTLLYENIVSTYGALLADIQAIKEWAELWVGKQDSVTRCWWCGGGLAEEEAVWVDPDTGEATTSGRGRAYHVACAPNEARQP